MRLEIYNLYRINWSSNSDQCVEIALGIHGVRPPRSAGMRGFLGCVSHPKSTILSMTTLNLGVINHLEFRSYRLPILRFLTWRIGSGLGRALLLLVPILLVALFGTMGLLFLLLQLLQNPLFAFPPKLIVFRALLLNNDLLSDVLFHLIQARDLLFGKGLTHNL